MKSLKTSTILQMCLKEIINQDCRFIEIMVNISNLWLKVEHWISVGKFNKKNNTKLRLLKMSNNNRSMKEKRTLPQSKKNVHVKKINVLLNWQNKWEKWMWKNWEEPNIRNFFSKGPLKKYFIVDIKKN